MSPGFLANIRRAQNGGTPAANLAPPKAPTPAPIQKAAPTKPAGSLVPRTPARRDGVLDIFSEEAAPGIAMFGAGLIDASRVGKAVSEATDGLIDASDLAFGASVVLRATGLDGFLPKGVQAVETHLLRGKLPVYGYHGGKVAMGAFDRFAARRDRDKTKGTNDKTNGHAATASATSEKKEEPVASAAPTPAAKTTQKADAPGQP